MRPGGGRGQPAATKEHDEWQTRTRVVQGAESLGRRTYEAHNSILELKEIRDQKKPNNPRDLNPTQQVSSSCSGHGGHVTHAGSSALEGASPAW